MPRQTLSKTERLKSYKRIRLLFAEGEKFRVSPVLVYYRFVTSSSPDAAPSSLQMGVSVSSRHFKRAVDRNLLKRRIRESYRKQKLALKASLEEKGLAMDLFLVYIEPKIFSYQEIDTAITEAMTKLIRRTASKMGA